MVDRGDERRPQVGIGGEPEQPKQRIDARTRIRRARDRAPQPIRDRIIDRERLARIGPSRLPTDPRCDGKRERIDGKVLCPPLGDRREQALRKLLRAIHRNLTRPVLKRSIGEPRHQRRAVGGEIEPGGRIERRRAFIPQGLDERARRRNRDNLVHEVEAGESAQIGDRRVGAVEQAQLGVLPGRDGVGQLDAERRKVGTRAGELVLDHPLQERLGLHHRLIGDAERLAQPRDIIVGGGRNDPVDHRLREGDLGGNPRGKRRIMRLRHREHRAAQQRPVVRQIVARHHGQRTEPRGATRSEPGDQQPRHRPRTVERREILHDVGITCLQRSGCPIELVPLLGHRQRDEVRLGRCDRRDDGGRVLRRDEDVDDRADDLQTLVAAVTFDHRVQPVLWNELVADLRGSQRHADDPPAQITACERCLEDRRLMCAVERADAEMHDAGPDRRAVIGGADDVSGQPVERGLRQPHSRYTCLTRS